MTTRILATIAIFFASLYTTTAQIPSKGVNIGIVYPFSTNGSNAGNCTNEFSFNLVAGVSAIETHYAFAGFSNIVRDRAYGFMGAGFSNHVRNGVQGFQIAGFMNTAGKNVLGLQLAGFMNTARNVYGGQIGGFMNIARKDAEFQVAGFFNHSGNTVMQTAGFMNIARNVGAVQAAGFCNLANDVSGAQVAGFMNKAKNVKGVQVAGFINIADSSDYPIGIVNIIQKGERSIGITIDETSTTLVAFRSGGRVMYGILGVGYNLKNDPSLYALEAGIGAHLLRVGNFRLNAEGALTTLTDFDKGVYMRSSLRVLPSYRFADRLEVFGGPTINQVYSTHNTGNSLVTDYIWSDRHPDHFNGMYIGGMVGLQCRIGK